jgi:hypothetical protein
VPLMSTTAETGRCCPTENNWTIENLNENKWIMIGNNILQIRKNRRRKIHRIELDWWWKWPLDNKKSSTIRIPF